MQFWTSHWRNCFWRNEINPEFERLDCSGSTLYRKRGVKPGDRAYIITISGGQLYLGGRFSIERIMSRDDLIRLRGNPNLYESATEWIVGPAKRGTPLNLHRRLHPSVARRLRFLSKSTETPKAPFFVDPENLDAQATRGVRQLTPDSANLLDQIISITDALPKSKQIMTVTDDMLPAQLLR